MRKGLTSFILILPALLVTSCSVGSAIDESALTLSHLPTQTHAPTDTASPAATVIPTATSDPSRFIDPHGIEMILIPEGEFMMGLDDGLGDERPAHAVYLDSYYIDLTETTNAQYKACVEAGVCELPQRLDCCTEFPDAYIFWPDYYENEVFAEYPVVFLRWLDADAYCEWRGARLPTEAEWEKAARGTDGRIYPWGDEEPQPGLLSYYWPPGTYSEPPVYTTFPVGSFPLGASPYGVLDMAGSVYEWVSDWYADDYYSWSSYENPQGPDEGFFKVSRGGSFFNQAFRQRSVGRNNAWLPVDSFHFDGGVRCVTDIP